MKRLVVLVGLATLTVAIAACSGTPTTGDPTGVPSTSVSSPGGGQDTEPSGPASSSSDPGALPVNQPCSLLSSDQLSQLGVTEQPTQDMVGTAHSCEISTDSAHIGVDIRTNVGLNGFTEAATGGPVHNVTVGSHQARQSVGNSGSCSIGIGVSASSRVDVTVTEEDETTDPCPTAETVAKFVEPNLP